MPSRPWTADLGRPPETPTEKAIAGGWEPSDWLLHRVAVTRWELAAARRGHDRAIEDAIRAGSAKATVARAAGFPSPEAFHNAIRRDRRLDRDDPRRRWPRIDAGPPYEDPPK